jgi:hypothetical protein
VSILDQNIALRKSLQDLCNARDLAIEEFTLAGECLKRSEQALNEITSHAFPWDAKPHLSLEKFIREIDRRMWRHAFDKTGLMQYMDGKARKEFDKELDKNPPAFTMENCRENLLSAASNADEFFVRGLVEFFLALSKRHKTNTNEPFKVGRKAILGYAVSNFIGMTVNYSTYSNGSDRVNDMDRIFKTLDGKKHQPRALESAINTAWKESNVFEDEYYRIKGFKNGNMHIEFKREDLLEKANKLISDYYQGQALATGAAA